MLKIVCLTLASFSVSTLAAELPATTKACLVRDVVAFGASVTMGTPAVLDKFSDRGYSTLVTNLDEFSHVKEWAMYLFGARTLPPSDRHFDNQAAPQPYGASPARYLVKYFGGDPNRITYYGNYFPNPDRAGADGAQQIDELLRGSKRELFEHASLLVGVDAFYWDAVWDTCGTAENPEGRIAQLIQAAKKAGKHVILGTVPYELDANVKIANVEVKGRGFWWAPKMACAASINQAIKENCTPDNGCYIADLKAAVDDLNCGIKLPLRDGGRYGLYQMRPDGVHLSVKGTRYIAELMERALEDAPPQCP